MPACINSRKIVRIFLGSPGDLEDERRVAKSVVDEFNGLWADTTGYQVELVGWEETVSGFGRPQAIINRDLERCEHFVGMVWKRWGTPPDKGGKFTSGFEEELTRSITSRKETGKPEVSLFFKEIDSDSQRDPGAQLRQVIALRDSIIAEKELYLRPLLPLLSSNQKYGDVLRATFNNCKLRTQKNCLAKDGCNRQEIVSNRTFLRAQRRRRQRCQTRERNLYTSSLQRRSAP